MADKRKSPPPPSSSSLVKRQRQSSQEDQLHSSSLIPISSNSTSQLPLLKSVKRTSGLSSPIVSLTGAHGAEILDVKFSPDGQLIAAASADRTISIWQTYGENANVGQLLGHSKAVTSLAWSKMRPSTLYSVSADGTLIVWSTKTGQKLRRLRGHRGIVNTIAVTRSGTELVVSGGDDGKVLIWDTDTRDPIDAIQTGYPVTSVEFSEDGANVFVGGLDNDIHIYDLTRKSITYTLRGHLNTISSLRLSPSGSHLLSTSMDETVRIWDVRPFAPEPPPGHKGNPRLHRTLTGSTSGFEGLLIKGDWSRDGLKVVSGGGDGCTVIWDVESGSILYKLPGHKGTCTAVSFHPREPIIVSSSTDKTMLLGEIDP